MPRLLGHFELLEKLDEGGMGAVYKARDLRIPRFVAIKFLSPRLSGTAEQRAALLREGQALGALGHPHVAIVHEVDEFEPFLVLEYLPGGTLRDKIRSQSGRLSIADVLNWGADLAEGLHHAHENGLVHRDVKTSNAMFDRNGGIKLTDFGLAAAKDGGSTGGGGTLPYMAPEQLDGARGDERSDLFSFGVVLYEMACGRRPFDGVTESETRENIRRARQGSVKAFRNEPRMEELDRIIGRLLEKRPEDRYGSAAEVSGELRALLDQLLDGTRTITFGETVKKKGWLRRAVMAAGAYAGIFALIANAGAIAEMFWRLSAPNASNLAVLPFRSIGGGAEQRDFCEGLTEALTSALAKDGRFSVVPYVDARRLESASQARREFGVTTVISGSVQRRGDEVRTILTVINARTGRQIEASPHRWPVSKLALLEDAVLARVGDLINVAFPQPVNPLAARATAMPSAYDAYLRGRGLLYRFDQSRNKELALAQFEIAVQQDPKFALGYVGVADARLRLYLATNEPVHLELAQRAAERALVLNPSFAGSHLSMGAVLAAMEKQEEALRELNEALAADPSDPAIYRELAAIYQKRGETAEVERVYRRALERRPGDWLTHSNLATFLMAGGRFEEAEAVYREVIRLTPDNPTAHRLRSVALIRLSRLGEAEAELWESLRLSPHSRSYSNLGALYLMTKRYAEAVPVLEKGVELSGAHPGDFAIFGNLGDAYQYSGGSRDRARAAWGRALGVVGRRLTTRPSDAEMIGYRGLYQAKLGESMAVESAAKAVTAASKNANVRFVAALSYALLGMREKSLNEIASAVELGYSLEEIRRAPEFGQYLGDPVFEKLASDPGSAR